MSSTPGAAAAGPAAPAAGGAAQSQEQAKAAGSAPGGVSVEPKIVRTAGLFITVQDVGAAAVRARAVAVGLGGRVVDESINATPVVPSGDVAPAGPATSTIRRGNYGHLTVAIPSDKLEQSLDQFAELGTVVQRTSAAKDITATYVDTESRIATKKASIERVRALLGQAKDVAQIVSIESELASREGELESLQAQLTAMSNQVAMSTVTIALSSNPDTIPVATDDTGGFVSGLKSGWNAFLSSLRVALTAIGALLPFLVLAALLYVLVRWWLTRRATTAEAPQPAASPRTPSAD
ncbi:MAG: DUF4349 domain-containing protein [Dermatophilaceae bacterium]|nr:DUF4349 domain-containing protein [Actinomycetales bacterium]